MFKLLFFLILSAMFYGCASNSAQPKYKSGFLDSYQSFRPNPMADNSSVQTKAGFTLKEFSKYDKVALAPIEVWLNSNQKMQVTDHSKQAALTEYFEKQIKANVGERIDFVDVGSTDSLLIKMALTNIQELPPEMEILDVLPFRIAQNAVESAYRFAAEKKAVIGAASLEAEFIDTNSGESLVAVIVMNNTGEVNVADKDDSIESIKLIIDDWVERLTKALKSK